ncbi:hypothetical protein [Microcystis phage Mwe-JY26]
MAQPGVSGFFLERTGADGKVGTFFPARKGGFRPYFPLPASQISYRRGFTTPRVPRKSIEAMRRISPNDTYRIFDATRGVYVD